MFSLRAFFRVFYRLFIRLLHGFMGVLGGRVRFLNPAALDKIGRIVSQSEGKNFKFVKCFRLDGASSYDESRCFWVVELLADDKETLTVFVKVSIFIPSRFKISRMLAGLDLPVPKYYGFFFVKAQAVALWQYHQGRVMRVFGQFTDVELSAASRVVARYNVIGAGCNVRRPWGGALWTGAVAHELLRLQSIHVELSERTEIISCFSNFEGQMLSVLREGRLCLNHNDFKAGNLILLEDGRCLITDLESSALGPLGSSLRCFAVLSHERRTLVVNEYVDQLSMLGVSCAPEFIHQVMCIQQVFWACHTGVRLHDIKRIGKGLDLYSRLFIVEDGRLFLRGGGEVGLHL